MSKDTTILPYDNKPLLTSFPSTTTFLHNHLSLGQVSAATLLFLHYRRGPDVALTAPYSHAGSKTCKGNIPANRTYRQSELGTAYCSSLARLIEASQ